MNEVATARQRPSGLDVFVQLILGCIGNLYATAAIGRTPSPGEKLVRVSGIGERAGCSESGAEAHLDAVPDVRACWKVHIQLRSASNPAWLVVLQCGVSVIQDRAVKLNQPGIDSIAVERTDYRARATGVDSDITLQIVGAGIPREIVRYYRETGESRACGT